MTNGSTLIRALVALIGTPKLPNDTAAIKPAIHPHVSEQLSNMMLGDDRGVSGDSGDRGDRGDDGYMLYIVEDLMMR